MKLKICRIQTANEFQKMDTYNEVVPNFHFLLNSLQIYKTLKRMNKALAFSDCDVILCLS
jgi:hypothetical protein